MNDLTLAAKLLHGGETMEYAEADYKGIEKLDQKKGGRAV